MDNLDFKHQQMTTGNAVIGFCFLEIKLEFSAHIYMFLELAHRLFFKKKLLH